MSPIGCLAPLFAYGVAAGGSLYSLSQLPMNHIIMLVMREVLFFHHNRLCTHTLVTLAGPFCLTST